MGTTRIGQAVALAVGFALVTGGGDTRGAGATTTPVLLVIDESSIDNGLRYAGDPDPAPIVGQQNIFAATSRRFTEADVNDAKASPTQRDVLTFFGEHTGRTISLMSGQVGDEGWFAPNCIPAKWISGTSNSCLAGGSAGFVDGLNRFVTGALRQTRLDRINDVRPLRAFGLERLEGQTVCAVVYDGSLSINYRTTAPYQVANLQGTTLGVVAFTVIADGVNRMNGFSSTTLPEVTVQIKNAGEICARPLSLFTDAPIPASSSGPNDVDPHGASDDREYVWTPPPPPPIDINQPPAILSTPITSGMRLEPYRYGIAASDPNNHALTYSLTTAPLGMAIDAVTGVIDWLPPGTGTLDVGVRVDDGHGGTATQTFVIDVGVPPNRPPELVPIANQTVPLGATLRIRLVANDPDVGETLGFSLLSGPAGVSLVNDPLLEWTPSAAQTGVHNINVRVDDAAGASDAGTFTVTVTTENVAPKFDPQSDASILPGASYTRAVTAIDPNPGDALTYTLLAGPNGLVMSADGQLSWTPGLSQLGAHTVRVKATDPGGLADVAMFTIAVDIPSADQAPIARDDRYGLRRGGSLVVPAIGVISNDLDPGGRPLTAALVTPPTRGAVTLAQNGAFTYTPNPITSATTEPRLAFEFNHLTATKSDVTGAQSGPVVADLDRDGRPEIIWYAQGTFSTRRLVAVRGDGSVHFSVDGYHPSGSPVAINDEPAVGDLDGDGKLEIVIPGTATGVGWRLMAFNFDGSYRWTSPDIDTGTPLVSSGALRRPYITDLDGDGKAEILVNHSGREVAPNNATQDYVTAFDHNGQPLWHCRGGNEASTVGDVAVNDLDLDGKPEIIFGNDVCSSNGTLLWSINLPSGRSMNGVAVGNLDDDPYGEIVFLDTSEYLHVYEHNGVAKWKDQWFGGTFSGRPVLGDVDGDGRPEILVAFGGFMLIVSRNATLVRQIDIPGLEGGTPTVFDLNGDGRPEILIHSAHGPFDPVTPADPQFGALYIFDGPTGDQLHVIAADRHVADELTPVIVADVDGDGSAAIVTRSWSENYIGARVFKAAAGKWAKTRPIWNQPAYDVTNINADGSLPTQFQANWLTPGLNSYRVNALLPGERTSDSDTFTYQVSNAALSSNVATVRLDILPPNAAPRILSTPPATATPSVEYLYAALAVDPDAGETLTFSLSLAPAGMTISSSSGLVRWTPNASQMGRAVAVVKVTDSQGESDEQQLIITVGAPAFVPDVTGLHAANAMAALASAGLMTTQTTSPSGAIPAGQVMSQEPVAGATVAAGSAVALVVSSGPAPLVVPHVVGKRDRAAISQLTGLGFGVTTTRAFSTTVPMGTVIGQTPAAGTFLVPGGVEIVVSAGTGLALRLERDLTPADEVIRFALLSYDLAGVETPATGLSLAVTAARTPFLGTLPAVNGNQIVPGAETRGVFRLTATDPATGRSVSADFAVSYPGPAGGASMTDDYAALSEAMADIDDLIREGANALAADNTPYMKSLLNQMVQRWRQVDTAALWFDVPLALENGFPPRPSDLATLGLTPTADDLLAVQVLRDAAADLQAWTDGLRAPGTSMAQLRNLADRFGTRAARFRGLTMSEWGVIRTQGTMAEIVSRRIPALYDALMGELAHVVANPASDPLDTPRGPSADPSTLAEQLTKIALDHIVEKLMDVANPFYANLKQFKSDVLFQAKWGAAAIAISQHVRAFVHGQDVTAVISGASMSFRVFNASQSMIEGDFDVENPGQNMVFLIGPSLTGPLTEAIEDFKSLMQLGKVPPDPNGGARNSEAVVQRLKAFYRQLISMSSVPDAGRLVSNVIQTPTQALRGCLFSSSSRCGSLLFDEGFRTVYEYSPPAAFAEQGFTGLPVPIIFIVYNATTSTMYFASPPFLPTPKK